MCDCTRVVTSFRVKIENGVVWFVGFGDFVWGRRERELKINGSPNLSTQPIFLVLFFLPSKIIVL
jgi:hypothetical protein